MKSLLPEDYIEPRCPLCEAPYGVKEEVKPVPQRRIADKLDDYMSRGDYAGAERHLLYWLEEAILGHDKRGELMLRGELVGHYRKNNERDKAFLHAQAALELLEELDYTASLSAATTYINIATAYCAFGENEAALPLFEKARTIYENAPAVKPELLGGLYNNMGLTYTALDRYEEALSLFDKAAEEMAQVPGSEAEQAISCLNKADALEAQDGQENEKAIQMLADRAWELLNAPTLLHDGYYAFVCEKCASVFAHYGYFSAAETLSARAKEIYERP